MNQHVFHVTLWGIKAWYVLACSIHFLAQRPLWHDELAVLSSIEVLTPHELFTQPLRMGQVFPRLYLYLIQAFSGLCGYSVLSLRFLPFVAMILAFLVWLRVARQELKRPEEFLTFALCWCASVPLIYYSAELKQYSMDVLVSGIFVLFLQRQGKGCDKGCDKGWKGGMAAAALPIMVLFSYPAYFFLVLPLWNMFTVAIKDRVLIRTITVYCFSIVVWACLSYVIDVRLRPVDVVTQVLRDYFISTQSPSDFFQTFTEGVNNLFSRWFVERPKVLRMFARVFMIFGLAQLIVGLVKMARPFAWRFTTVSAVAPVVFLELALAGVLSKYPFGVPRTALFLCPILLLLTVQGISFLRSVNRYAYIVVHGAFVAYLVVVALGIMVVLGHGPLIAIPEIWAS